MHDRHRHRAGFTLIEILVVMAIIALLAGLVGPRLIRQQEKAQVKATRTQVEMLGTALDTFRLDVGRYPTSALRGACTRRARVHRAPSRAAPAGRPPPHPAAAAAARAPRARGPW
jgi:prepilin-type N-terminal cleavage/methylation domain-containing protein